jgi:hypothetical protein
VRPWVESLSTNKQTKPQWGKDSPSSIIENWTSTCKRMKLNPYLTLFPKLRIKTKI